MIVIFLSLINLKKKSTKHNSLFSLEVTWSHGPHSYAQWSGNAKRVSNTLLQHTCIWILLYVYYIFIEVYMFQVNSFIAIFKFCTILVVCSQRNVFFGKKRTPQLYKLQGRHGLIKLAANYDAFSFSCWPSPQLPGSGQECLHGKAPSSPE